MYDLIKRRDINDVFLMAGKALILVQLFEAECKGNYALLKLSSNIKLNKYEKDKSLKTDLQKYYSFMLGKSLKELEKLGLEFITQEVIDILVLAKDSRNYICHESLKLIDFSKSNSLITSQYIETTETHIENITKGMYIFEQWEYWVNEKEAFPISEKDYILRIKTGMGF